MLGDSKVEESVDGTIRLDNSVIRIIEQLKMVLGKVW